MAQLTYDMHEHLALLSKVYKMKKETIRKYES